MSPKPIDGQARQRDAGGDLADDGDALLGQVEQARQRDPHDERDERARDRAARCA